MWTLWQSRFSEKMDWRTGFHLFVKIVKTHSPLLIDSILLFSLIQLCFSLIQLSKMVVLIMCVLQGDECISLFKIWNFAYPFTEIFFSESFVSMSHSMIFGRVMFVEFLSFLIPSLFFGIIQFPPFHFFWFVEIQFYRM